MSWINLDDVEAQLRSKGLVLDKDLKFDASYQRWKVDGEDNEKRGWSRLSEWTNSLGHTYIVGVYGVFFGTDDGKTKIELPRRDDSSRPTLSDADVAAIREAQRVALQRLAEKRKAEAKEAAQWAALVWSKCMPCGEHEYLTRKGIQPHGLRVLGDTTDIALPGVDDSNFYRLKKAVGALVVPMHDAHGNVCGIQFIYPRGHERIKKSDKEFWPSGMAMGGTFGVIGPINRTGVLLVGEGFATMASLHEASGQSVAYAFSANNLGKAAKLLRKVNPRLKLLFCADDDYKTEGNPGVTAAVQATAELENCAWLKPDFTAEDGSDRRNERKLTDFNDLFMLTGVPLTLANQINAKLDALKWRDTQPARGAISAGGAGEDSSGRRKAVSVLSLDEVVERFVCIDDDTGDFVFDTWTRAVCKRSKMITLLPAGVRMDEIKRHPVWQQRAVYIDQIGFDPAGEDKNILCNRWMGWPTVPKAGNCDQLLSLLSYLCSGDGDPDTLFKFVLRWLAYPIQHPGAKMHSAIVVHGPQGTGKSRFFEAYAKIFGEYSIILNQGAIEDKFNADWSERRLFVLADEVVANTERYHLKNQLKNFITSDWVRINPKNVAAHKERNHMNLVFLSNELQPVVLENDDRRHCVIYTPAKLDESFYTEVTEEINNGGIEALHAYLLALDLGDMKPWTRPPMTDAKRQLILSCSSSEERFISEWFRGYFDFPFCPIAYSTLMAEYIAWCRRENEAFGRNGNQLCQYIRKIGWYEGETKRQVDVNDSTVKTWRCIIPSDEAMEKSVKNGGEDYRHRQGDTKAKWLAECYYAVDFALSERNRQGRNAA